MKNEDLFRAMTDIDDEFVESAEKASRKPKIWIYVSGFAAVLLIALIVVPAIKGGLEKSGDEYPAGVIKVLAAYPTPVAEWSENDKSGSGPEYQKWSKDRSRKVALSRQMLQGMDGFNMSVMQQILEAEDENTVCSPVNMYFAISMLAEITDGNTRKQILDMLGVTDIETLREKVKAIWEYNYMEAPTGECLPANSLWLSNDRKYNEETLNILAGQYYASTFSGKPGTKVFDDALKIWIDDNTKGLLSDYTKDLKNDERMIIKMVSTLYYRSVWTREFKSEDNTRAVFHGTKGDSEVEMMHRAFTGTVYGNDKYTAISLVLSDDRNMFFYLPDEGVDVNELLYDPDVLRALEWKNNEDLRFDGRIVNLDLPKFKISADTDLTDALKNLGVTDAFDENTADFSPLYIPTDGGTLSDAERSDGIFVSSAEHAAMLEIDEHGVTAAAFTVIEAAGAAQPKETIDFTLDRPFMFIICGQDGSVLFSGIVRNIEGD